MNTENQTLNLNTIIKIIYKNKALIALITVITIALATAFVFLNKSFKTEINLYGNDKVLTEIGENSQYSLSSFEFFSYIKNHSKTLKNLNLPENKFLKEMSTRLTTQTETGDPMVKVKFSTKSKSEGENFSKEYHILAQNYLADKKNSYLNSQLKLLDEQYKFISKNTDIINKTLNGDIINMLKYVPNEFADLIIIDPPYSSPVIKYINSTTKPSLNKKLVLAAALFVGLFLGIFAAFVKDFSNTLDWKDIKSKK